MGADLFGAWLVEMSYGRIGTMGRSKVRSFATAADARPKCAHASASARRRRDGSGSRIVYGAQARRGLGPMPHSMIGFVYGSVDRKGAVIYHNVGRSF